MLMHVFDVQLAFLLLYNPGSLPRNNSGLPSSITVTEIILIGMPTGQPDLDSPSLRTSQAILNSVDTDNWSPCSPSASPLS